MLFLNTDFNLKNQNSIIDKYIFVVGINITSLNKKHDNKDDLSYSRDSQNIIKIVTRANITRHANNEIW